MSPERRQEQTLAHPLLNGTRPGWTLETSATYDYLSKSSIGDDTGNEAPSKPVVSAVYRHDDSGMRFVLTDTKTAMVRITLMLPTASPDDRGLPHTLEHLVHSGSLRHPKHGYLTAAGARLIAKHGNASTARYYTDYVITTAGSDGAFAYLPMLIDHVLHPLLNEDHFVTEVYHVKPDGQGGGVVYSEVLNDYAGNIVMLWDTVSKFLCPADTPFPHESGGRPFDVPNLVNEDIIEYHRKYYDPKYMVCAITGGGLTPEALFDAIDKVPGRLLTPRDPSLYVESSVIVDNAEPIRIKSPKMSVNEPLPSLPRPLFIPRWPAGASQFETRRVEFASGSDDDSNAQIVYFWGGLPYNDSRLIKAINVLLFVLFSADSSPMNMSFCRGSSDGQKPWATDVSAYPQYLGWNIYSAYFERVVTPQTSNGTANDDVNDDGVADDSMPDLTLSGPFYERFRNVLLFILEHGFTEHLPPHLALRAATPSLAATTPSASAANIDSTGGVLASTDGISEKRDKRDLVYIHSVIDSTLMFMLNAVDEDFGSAVHADVEVHIRDTQFYKTLSPEMRLLYTNPALNESLDISDMISTTALYHDLKSEPMSFWRDLYRRYIVDAPILEVILVPSKQMARDNDEALRELGRKRANGDIIESLMRDKLNKQDIGSTELPTKLAEIRRQIIDHAVKGAVVDLDKDDYDSMPPAPDVTTIPNPPTLSRLIRIEDLPSIDNTPVSSLQNQVPFRGVIAVETEAIHNQMNAMFSYYGLPKRLAAYWSIFIGVLHRGSIWIPRGSRDSSSPLDQADADFYEAIAAHSKIPERDHVHADGHVLLEESAIEAYDRQELKWAIIPNTMYPALTIDFTLSFMSTPGYNSISYDTCTDTNQKDAQQQQQQQQQQQKQCERYPPYSRAIRWIVNMLVNIKFERKNVLDVAHNQLRRYQNYRNEPESLLQEVFWRLYADNHNYSNTYATKMEENAETETKTEAKVDPIMFNPSVCDTPVDHFGIMAAGTVSSYESDFVQLPFLKEVVKVLEECNEDGSNVVIERLEEIREFLIAKNGCPSVKVPLYKRDCSLDRELDVSLPGLLLVGVGVNNTEMDSAENIAAEFCAVWDREVSAYTRRRQHQKQGKPQNEETDAQLPMTKMSLNASESQLPHALWYPVTHDIVPDATRVYVVDSPAADAANFRIGWPARISGAQVLERSIHPDIPTMNLLFSILERADGLLFQAVRGAGHSYAFGLELLTRELVLSISVGPASNPVLALKEIVDLIIRLRDDIPFWLKEVAADHHLDIARADAMFDEISNYDQPLYRMKSQTHSILRGYPTEEAHKYSHDWERLLRSATAADLRRCFVQYFVPLVDPTKSKVAVLVVATEQIESQAAAFAEQVPGCTDGPIVLDPAVLEYKCPPEAL